MIKSDPDKIVAKIVLSAELQNTEWLVMGNGTGDYADKSIALINGVPYLDSESLGGVFISHIRNNFIISDELSKYAFGNHDSNNPDDSLQSHLQFLGDGYLTHDSAKPRIEILDGIKINVKNGSVEQGKKYDYECLANQCTFAINLVFTVREKFNSLKPEVKKLFATLKNELIDGNIKAGAFTRRGFGSLKAIKCFVAEYNTGNWSDFMLNHYAAIKNKATVIGKSPVGCMYINSGTLNDAKILTNKRNSFIIEGDFQIAETLIAGGGKIISENNDAPDKRNTQFNSKYAIHGKSLVGSLHTGFRKILSVKLWNAENNYTIEDVRDLSNKIMQHIMGYVDEKNKLSRSSRLIVNTSHLSETNSTIRHRIALDAFTGGTIVGGKFDSEPLDNSNKKAFKVKIEIINPFPFEKALLIYFMRDLACKRVAIGGEKSIFSGRLTASKLTITDSCISDLINYNDSVANKPIEWSDLQVLPTMMTEWDQLNVYLNLIKEIENKSSR